MISTPGQVLLGGGHLNGAPFGPVTAGDVEAIEHAIDVSRVELIDRALDAAGVPVWRPEDRFFLRFRFRGP